jgi:hypothetical protein
MKIAIVQFYAYHEEVLAPQIDFLLPDNELYVAAPEEIFSNDYIASFRDSIKKIFFSNRKYNKAIYNIPLRIFSIFCKYRQFSRIIKKENIKLIIFNTINKHFHFIFIRFYFKNIEKIHIIHNAQLFATQKEIKALGMFKKNLFISLEVLNYQKEIFGAAVENIDWFLPALGNFVSSEADEKYVCKDKIVIVVPGSVDYSRRNYEGLFGALEKVNNPSPILQIILLGKISPERQREIDRRGLGAIIKTYDQYVSGEEMLQTIKHADAVAFLIDRHIGDNYQLYNRFKASGTSALCLSFGVPCIVSDDFHIDEALRDRAIVYPGSDIEKIFINIMNGTWSKNYFMELKRKPLPLIYSAEQQRLHYREIVGL